MTDQTNDNSDGLATPAEVFKALHAQRTEAPAGRVRVSVPFSGSVSLSEGGAVLKGDGTGDDYTRRAIEAAVDSSVTVGSLVTDLNAIEQELKFVNERLASKEHDPRTGEAIYHVNGAQRAALESQRSSLIEEQIHTKLTRQYVAQRDAEAASTAQHKAETELTLDEWAGNDPERAAALKRARLDMEARQLVEWAQARHLKNR